MEGQVAIYLTLLPLLSTSFSVSCRPTAPFATTSRQDFEPVYFNICFCSSHCAHLETGSVVAPDPPLRFTMSHASAMLPIHAFAILRSLPSHEQLRDILTTNTSACGLVMCSDAPTHHAASLRTYNNKPLRPAGRALAKDRALAISQDCRCSKIPSNITAHLQPAFFCSTAQRYRPSPAPMQLGGIASTARTELMGQDNPCARFNLPQPRLQKTQGAVSLRLLAPV